MGGTTGSWTKEPKDKRLLSLQWLSGMITGGWIQSARLTKRIGTQKTKHREEDDPPNTIVKHAE